MSPSCSLMASIPRKGRNWLMAGQKTTVKTTESRTCLNLMGILNLADISKTGVREYDRIDSYHIAEFFIALRETYPISQKVHIIFIRSRLPPE
ncbi:hypothetical protein BA1DRAFT_04136 [Photorhabdus aegyptia]|uniref:Tc1-like transposase DDE domain-containing protein n=1 Tax=Photorhabdus aegyptia TaxID=2805098 RepID=A0A022PEK7_9GAMM|nr:hypothetical protein BA1DRAFT_04136 [Photorhabdus aegyptia]